MRIIVPAEFRVDPNIEVKGHSYAYGFIRKFTVIKYHQLLSKVVSINWKLHFNQLATASFSSPPPLIKTLIFP